MRIFLFKLVLIITLFFLGFVGLLVNIIYIFIETIDAVINNICNKIENKVDSL